MRQHIISGVYQIKNELNGKFYIGSSVNIDQRWRAHRNTFKHPPKYNSRLRAAVEKYGIENFTFTVIEECEPIKKVLLEREQHYIDTFLPDYNILPTAGSNLGFKQPPSFFEKRCGLEPWNKNVPISEEQKAVLFAGRDAWQEEHGSWNKGTHGLMPEPWSKGKPLPEEVRQKISEANTGKETWNKGVQATDEQRQRMSEIAKANFDPEQHAKMTEAARLVNLGKERSEETRNKISASNLISEARKAFSETRRGVARTDQERANMSEGLRTSDKAAAYHAGRIGKSRGNNPSGHYGVIWDKARNKWQVRVQGKSYGRFEMLEDAIKLSKELTE